jgi:energy-converting hydrogenase Eha subunit A
MGFVNNNSGIAPVIEGCFRLLIFIASSVMFAIALLSLYYLADEFDNINLNPFSAIVGIIFGALVRFFQVTTMFFLMCDMTLITYKPFGRNYVRGRDKFIEIFRINRFLLLSFMMLVGVTVKSTSYEDHLHQQLASSSIQGVYRRLELQQQQTSLPYQPIPHNLRLLQELSAECDENGFNTAFPEDSEENDIIFDSNIVANVVMFSRVALFVVGIVLFLSITVLTILENRFNYSYGRITHQGGNEQSDHDRKESWTHPTWYDMHPSYLDYNQRPQDRLHYCLISLQPLAAFGLEISILIVGLRDVNFRSFLDTNHTGETTIQFIINHLAAMIMSFLLFLSVLKKALKRKNQIFHTVQYVMGVYLLCQASSNFLHFFEAIFIEKEEALSTNVFRRKTAVSVKVVDYSLLVIIASLVILLLPVLIHFIVFVALKFQSNEERTPRRRSNHRSLCVSTDGVRNGIQAIAKNATSPWKIYRAFHCLSLLCGVASIITASLSWGSPIASVSVLTGDAFRGLYDGVEKVEDQLEALADALSSMHRSLDPCGKSVDEASNTDDLLKKLSEGKNIEELFQECFDGKGNWKDGLQKGSDHETNCTELREGSARLDDTINVRDNSDPSQYISTNSNEAAVCPIPNFDEPEEPDNVDQTCENIQCGIFFGTMVTLTAASAVPFAGSGAVFAKVAARVARKTVLLGRRLGKTARTVNKKKGDLIKAARILKKVAGVVSSLALYAEYQFLWALAPVFFVGLFCIFIGFWRRTGLHDVGSSAVLTVISLILTLMNFGSFILSFFLIAYLQEILSLLPEELVVVTIKAEIGLSLLKASYGLASFSALCWTIFSAIASVLISFGPLSALNRLFYKRPSEGVNEEGGTVNQRAVRRATSDSVGGWVLTTFIVSIPVLWLAIGGLVRKDRAIVYGAWNNDDANNVVDAMRSSGVMGKSTEVMDEDVAAMGCGPVGQVVGKVAEEIFRAIQRSLPDFNISFNIMNGAAAAFLQALAGANLFNPFQPLLIFPSYSVIEWVVLFMVPLLCTLMLITGTIMMAVRPDSVVVPMIRSSLLSLIFVGVQMCISIGGLASVLDSVRLPFFEVRVEWGKLLVQALIANGICFIGCLALWFNAFLPISKLGQHTVID